VYIGIIALLLLALAFLITFAYNRTIAPMDVILTMTAEPTIPDGCEEEETENHQSRKATIALLGLASSTFVIISKNRLFQYMSIF